MAGPTLDRTPTQQAQVASDGLGCDYIMLGHGHFALVDKGLGPEIMERTWHRNKRGYAGRLKHVGKRSCRLIYLHLEIFQPDNGLHADHENRNKLDNRRTNLRAATRIQNSGNAGKRKQAKEATSKYKGVSFDNGKQRWLAQGRSKGKMVFLGRFKDEEIAARTYDAWASKHFGVFAYLNFP